MQGQETRIKIRSELYETEASLFSEIALNEDSDTEFFTDEEEKELSDVLELNTIGTVSHNGNEISVTYAENDDSGMDGSNTSIIFNAETPDIITMVRTGTVSTTMVFEAGKRHHCVYETPFMPFEVGVYTRQVVNRISKESTLSLDYIIEIRGAKAEHTRFFMTLL